MKKKNLCLECGGKFFPPKGNEDCQLCPSCRLENDRLCDELEERIAADRLKPRKPAVRDLGLNSSPGYAGDFFYGGD